MYILTQNILKCLIKNFRCQIKNMSENVEKILQAISDELGNLHLKWLFFLQLYDEKEEIIDLLNESAPMFFGVCQSIFLNDVILSISRLTDPSQTDNKANLTLEQLLDAIDPSCNQLKTELKAILSHIKCNSDFARVSRNRRVAHTDLKTYFQEHPEPLPDTTKEKIEEVLFGLRDFINKVELHFLQREIGYEHLDVLDGANSLIGCLYDAKSYRDQLFQRANNSLRAD